jgi:hypothetical protein
VKPRVRCCAVSSPCTRMCWSVCAHEHDPVGVWERRLFWCPRLTMPR